MSKINLKCEEPHGVAKSEKSENSNSLFVLSKGKNDTAWLNVFQSLIFSYQEGKTFMIAQVYCMLRCKIYNKYLTCYIIVDLMDETGNHRALLLATLKRKECPVRKHSHLWNNLSSCLWIFMSRVFLVLAQVLILEKKIPTLLKHAHAHTSEFVKLEQITPAMTITMVSVSRNFQWLIQIWIHIIVQNSYY